MSLKLNERVIEPPPLNELTPVKLPKEIGELSFRQAVLKVKLRKDAIAVALRDRVYVYHLADLSLRDKIYTADNPFGLLSLSTQVQDMVLACPSVTTGHVRVELYGLRKTVVCLCCFWNVSFCVCYGFVCLVLCALFEACLFIGCRCSLFHLSP